MSFWAGNSNFAWVQKIEASYASSLFEFLYWPSLTWINLLQIEDVHRPLWEYGLGKKKTRHLWNYVGILWINIRRSLHKPILWESRKFSSHETNQKANCSSAEFWKVPCTFALMENYCRFDLVLKCPTSFKSTF